MSCTLYLARHASHAEVGGVLSGRSNIALSAQGQVEAVRLARRLADTPLTAIYSSPRRRCRETAEAVGVTHGLPIHIEAELDEIDFGEWSGRRFADLDDDATWRTWNSERATALTPAGDSMTATVTRALSCIARVARAGTVLCVTHCDVIRGLLAHWLGLGVDRIFSFECAPASLATVSISGGRARVVTMNEQPA